MTRILCISGNAGCGKDTSAELIRKHLWGEGRRVLITHFADLLKFICSHYFNWDGKKDEHGRELLQRIGTDVIREDFPNYWVAHVAYVLRMFPDQWEYVLIPDCRFPNEISYLKDWMPESFEVTHIRVHRPDYDSGLTNEQKQHASENALNGCNPDYILENTSTISELARNVMTMLNKLYGE